MGLYIGDEYYAQYTKGMKMTDNIPPDTLKFINEHWSTFDPINPVVIHFIGFVMFIMFFVSTIGNFLVIYIFLKTPSLRTATNIFIINLAISDFTFMFSNAPLTTVTAMTARYWIWGETACEVYGYIGAFAGINSLLSMIVIGYDRYNIIVKGFNGVKITPGKAVIIVVTLWAYSLGINAPALFEVWGKFRPEGLLLTCSYDYLDEDPVNLSYILFTLIFMYIFPLGVIIYFYSGIVKAVVSHEAALKAQAKKMNVDSLRSNVNEDAESAEVRIAKVAITNVCLWFITWSPYAVVVTLPLLGKKHLVTPLVSQFPALFAKTATCFNPLVFAISHPKYREALSKECPCLGIVEGSSGGGGGGAKNETESVKTTTA